MFKKRLISVLLAATMFLTAIPFVAITSFASSGVCGLGGIIAPPSANHNFGVINGNMLENNGRPSLNINVLNLINDTCIKANEVYGIEAVTFGEDSNRQVYINVNDVVSPMFHGSSTIDVTRINAIMSNGNIAPRTPQNTLTYMNMYGGSPKVANNITTLASFVTSSNPSRFDVKIRSNQTSSSSAFCVASVNLLSANGDILGTSTYSTQSHDGKWSAFVPNCECGGEDDIDDKEYIFGGTIAPPIDAGNAGIRVINGNALAGTSGNDATRRVLNIDMLNLIDGTEIKANEIYGIEATTFGDKGNRQVYIDVKTSGNTWVASPQFHGSSTVASDTIQAIMVDENGHKSYPVAGIPDSGRMEINKLVYMNQYGGNPKVASNTVDLVPFVTSESPNQFDVRIRANNDGGIGHCITSFSLLDAEGEVLGTSTYSTQDDVGEWSEFVPISEMIPMELFNSDGTMESVMVSPIYNNTSQFSTFSTDEDDEFEMLKMVNVCNNIGADNHNCFVGCYEFQDRNEQDDPSGKYVMTIMGDGFTADGGEQDKFITAAANVGFGILTEPPFTLFADKIDIYAIKVVSDVSSIEELSHNTYFGSDYFSGYHSNVIVPTKNVGYIVRTYTPDSSASMVIINSNIYSRGVCLGSVSAVTFNNQSSQSNIILHELGHSIGDLSDEYAAENIQYAANVSQYDGSNRWHSFENIFGGGVYSIYGTDPNAELKYGEWVRPYRNCKMSNSDSRFCYVCRAALTERFARIFKEPFYGRSEETSMTIPLKTDNDITVTRILDYAFYGCDELYDVAMPNTVKSIGSFAFLGTKSLTSIIIPESVEFIDYSAFINSSVTVIRGTPGSYAQTFAEYIDGLTFIPLIINIKDESFAWDETEINNLFNKELTSDDIQELRYMLKLQSLNLSMNQIEYITSLEYLTELQVLNLSNNNIEFFRGLRFLNKLKELNVSSNPVGDFLFRNYLPLNEFPNLEKLNISNINISNISKLTDTPNLTWLDISGNDITDISPLANLTDLQTLNLSDNQITDLTPLEGLTNLTSLDLTGNPLIPSQVKALQDIYNALGMNCDIRFERPTMFVIGGKVCYTNSDTLNLRDLQLTDEDIKVLVYFENLIQLDLSGNSITDISPLSELKGLMYLSLDDNQITDITPLSEMAGLRQLTMKNNEVISISPLSGLTELDVLYLRNNQIGDITDLWGLNIRLLDLGQNQINDLTSLTGMMSLYTLWLDNNLISDITSLYYVGGLRALSLRNNPLTWEQVNHLQSNLPLGSGFIDF